MARGSEKSQKTAKNILQSKRVSEAFYGELFRDILDGNKIKLKTAQNTAVEIGASLASQLSYDNSSSGLIATDVQAALDEIVSNMPQKIVLPKSSPTSNSNNSAPTIIPEFSMSLTPGTYVVKILGECTTAGSTTGLAIYVGTDIGWEASALIDGVFISESWSTGTPSFASQSSGLSSFMNTTITHNQSAFLYEGVVKILNPVDIRGLIKSENTGQATMTSGILICEKMI